MATITKDIECGIYNTAYVLRTYKDRAILTVPFIKWVDNSGNLDFYKHRITNPAALTAIKRALAGDYPEVDRYGDGYDDAEDYIMRTAMDEIGC